MQNTTNEASRDNLLQTEVMPNGRVNLSAGGGRCQECKLKRKGLKHCQKHGHTQSAALKQEENGDAGRGSALCAAGAVGGGEGGAHGRRGPVPSSSPLQKRALAGSTAKGNQRCRLAPAQFAQYDHEPAVTSACQQKDFGQAEVIIGRQKASQVRVQPGELIDKIRKRLRSHHKFFETPVDPIAAPGYYADPVGADIHAKTAWNTEVMCLEKMEQKERGKVCT